MTLDTGLTAGQLLTLLRPFANKAVTPILLPRAEVSSVLDIEYIDEELSGIHFFGDPHDPRITLHDVDTAPEDNEPHDLAALEAELLLCHAGQPVSALILSPRNPQWLLELRPIAGVALLLIPEFGTDYLVPLLLHR